VESLARVAAAAAVVAGIAAIAIRVAEAYACCMLYLSRCRDV
jgi:hypothetical protein